jgi:hypothetical protein
MTKRALLLAGLLVPALATSATAAPAAKPLGGIRTAVFKVSFEGRQSNEWTNHHEKTQQCDYNIDGEGDETMRFASKRPTRVVVTSFPGAPSMLIRVKGSLSTDIGGNDLDYKGKATRHAKTVISGWDPKCGGKGGGGYATPDCGTRRFGDGSALLSFQPGDRLTLGGGILPAVPLFKDCPLLGTGAPDLLDTNSAFKPITSKWPRSEVFDKSHRKFIIIGRGKQVRKDAETSDTTRIRWEATFVRVKH